MAKQKKGGIKPIEASNREKAVLEAINILIEMEGTELQTMIKLRNMMTDICLQKQKTLVMLGNMSGLDTSIISSLKVN